jgi:hypothetical protein
VGDDSLYVVSELSSSNGCHVGAAVASRRGPVLRRAPKEARSGSSQEIARRSSPLSITRCAGPDEGFGRNAAADPKTCCEAGQPEGTRRPGLQRPPLQGPAAVRRRGRHVVMSRCLLLGEDGCRGLDRYSADLPLQPSRPSRVVRGPAPPHTPRRAGAASPRTPRAPRRGGGSAGCGPRGSSPLRRHARPAWPPLRRPRESPSLGPRVQIQSP